VHIVTKEVEFDAGHRVPDHKSKCQNPHGHRYKVKVHIEGPLQTVGSSNGMVLDFSDIKSMLTSRVHDWLDHGFMVYTGDSVLREAFATVMDMWKIVLVDFVPTAENLAENIYTDLSEYMAKVKMAGNIIAVEVHETPTSIATYHP